MRHLRKCGPTWQVVGPQGGVIREHSSYSLMRYFALFGREASSEEVATKELKRLVTQARKGLK